MKENVYRNKKTKTIDNVAIRILEVLNTSAEY